MNDETEDGLLLLSSFDDTPHCEVIDAASGRWFDRRGVVVAKSAWRRDRVALSCGSIPIDPALLRQANGPGKAWVINVPTDAITGEGMYEIAASPLERCTLDMAADDCAGQIGLRWLEHLNREGRSVADRWKGGDSFGDMRLLEPTTHLTYVELVTVFSRLGTAGEEATRVGLTGWAPGTATAALWKCFVDMTQADARRAGRPADAPGHVTLNAIRPD